MSFDTEGVGLKLAFIYLEGRIKILKWKLQGKNIGRCPWIISL